MKKKLLLSLAAMSVMSVMSVSAQTIQLKSKNIGIVPGQATTSGKTYLYSYERNGNKYDVEILDSKLKTQKNMHIELPMFKHKSYEAIGKSKVKLSDILNIESNPFIYYYSTGVTTTEKLIEFLGFEDYGTMTDSKGNTLVFTKADWNFFQGNQAYPEVVYYLQDDDIWRIDFNYSIDRSKLSDITAADLTWTPIPGTEEESEERAYIAEITWCDLDAGMGLYDTDDFLFSQNIFNNDDHFEYLVEDYDPSISSESKRDEYIYLDTYNYTISEDGYICFKTRRYDNVYPNCLRLINDEGTVLGTIRSDDDDVYLLRMDGKLYINVEMEEDNEYYDCLYLLDDLKNGVKLVKKNRMDVHPTVVSRGEQIRVTHAQMNDANTLVITDANGRIIESQKAGQEHHENIINTSGLSRGVYNVTVKGRASNDTQRFVVK